MKCLHDLRTAATDRAELIYDCRFSQLLVRRRFGAAQNGHRVTRGWIIAILVSATLKAGGYKTHAQVSWSFKVQAALQLHPTVDFEGHARGHGRLTYCRRARETIVSGTFRIRMKAFQSDAVRFQWVIEWAPLRCFDMTTA